MMHMEFVSGTSMATPHISGAMALLWSAIPSLRNQIDASRTAMNNAAHFISSTQCGDAGPPNNVYGWGRVDIFAAVGGTPSSDANTDRNCDANADPDRNPKPNPNLYTSADAMRQCSGSSAPLCPMPPQGCLLSAMAPMSMSEAVRIWLITLLTTIYGDTTHERLLDAAAALA